MGQIENEKLQYLDGKAIRPLAKISKYFRKQSLEYNSVLKGKHLLYHAMNEL